MSDSARPVVERSDSTEAVAFLQKLHSQCAVQIVTMLPDGRPSARTFEADQKLEMEKFIESKQGTHNIYFSVNQLRVSAANKKAAKADVVSSHCLHVDIDDVSALPRVLNAKKPPTAVIFSGGGYQVFYRLKSEVFDLELIERCNAALAKELGGDNCSNADRIMRVPCTVNVPNKKKRANGRKPVVAYVVEEGTDWSREYSIEDFDQTTFDIGRRADSAVMQGPINPISLHDLPSEVTAATRQLIEFGDDPQRPIGSGASRYHSRSEVVFRVACDLARAGIADEVIAGVLLNPALGISASILTKRAPQNYALRQAVQGRLAVGKAWPDVAKNGVPRSTLRNTLVAISRLGLHCEYDEFHQRKIIGGHTLQAFQGELSDDGCAVLRNEILRQFGFDPGKDHTREAANTCCLENMYHPIRDYLAGLEWDRQPRLARWLVDYLGADDTPLNQAFGELILVAAVRRVRQPGCKFDTVLVLEGPQGSGKSTAIQILAGPDNFSDQEILTLDAKAQMEAVEGVWIYELAELAGLRRADTTRVKAFASRSVDQARLAYGRFREKRPRQNVFIGTTNDDQYLHDATGNRRFWPVKTREIRLEALSRDRDQLWAEAALVEATGASLTLEEGLWEVAREAQEARMEDEPWMDVLQNLSTERTDGAGNAASGDLKLVDGMYRISTSSLLLVLGLETQNVAAWQLKRLANCMRKLGFEGPSNFKFDGKVMKGYQITADKIAQISNPTPDY
ncbi:VapE domain-containing protein [Methylobacterium segetis]|uniref:VapE domain-containing protein n=1 Tax=Methylobacterium segetis TaxID=2488750 RepID=UPI0010508BBB|nr:VapE domain-containing protein [Methylobacterium segetis]